MLILYISKFLRCNEYSQRVYYIHPSKFNFSSVCPLNRANTVFYYQLLDIFPFYLKKTFYLQEVCGVELSLICYTILCFIAVVTLGAIVGIGNNTSAPRSNYRHR